MRLPPPVLACGCASCTERLNEDFMRLVHSSFSLADEKNIELRAERLVPPISATLAERIHPYTLRGTEF